MSGMIVSSVIGFVGGNKAADTQAGAARDAASTQAASNREAIALQREMFEKQNQLQEPFRQAGIAGQNQLLTLLGLAPSGVQGSGGGGGGGFGGGVANAVANAATRQLQGSGLQVNRNSPDFGKYASAEFGADKFKTDPSYAFRMAEGMKALERSAAARGGLLSGATMKGIQRYGQDLASMEYQNAFNRYQTERTNTLNPFQSLAGVAQTSANTLGSQAGTYGANVGNLMSATGASNANALLAAGNARASAYQGYGTAAGQAIQGINSFFRNQSTPSYSGPSYGSNSSFDNSFYDTMSYD